MSAEHILVLFLRLHPLMFFWRTYRWMRRTSGLTRRQALTEARKATFWAYSTNKESGASFDEFVE